MAKWYVGVLELKDTADLRPLCMALIATRTNVGPYDKTEADYPSVEKMTDALRPRYRLKVTRDGEMVGWYVAHPPPSESPKLFKVEGLGFIPLLSKEDHARAMAMLLKKSYEDYSPVAESVELTYHAGTKPGPQTLDLLGVSAGVVGVETTTDRPKVMGATISMEDVRKRLEDAGIL